jgi:hypothetical protein
MATDAKAVARKRAAGAGQKGAGQKGAGAPAADPGPSSLWQLAADPRALEQVALAWTRLGQDVSRVATDGLRAPAQNLVPDWAGAVADAYRDYAKQLTGRMDRAGELAAQMASAVDQIRYTLAAAQSQLDASFAKATAVAPYTVDNGAVTFHPATIEATILVDSEEQNAQEIRDYYRRQLDQAMEALRRLRREFEELVAAGERAGEAGGRYASLLSENSGTSVLMLGNQMIINTGSGDDKVRVSNAAGGALRVNVNGTPYTVPAGVLPVIRSGAGDDTVTVDPNVRVNVVILGGDGNDTITGGAGSDTILAGAGNDKVQAGAGDNYVSGGSGNDYLAGGRGNDTLRGGRGEDVLYGLGGNDRLAGGRGQDYLDGGDGDDRLYGGPGNDILFGGRGADRIIGGAGDDRAFGGQGRDTVLGGSGNDTAYIQKDDSAPDAEKVVQVEYKPNLGDRIKIVGTQEFVDRVRSDMEALRSMPGGPQRMLADDNGPYGTLPFVDTDGNYAYLGRTLTIQSVDAKHDGPQVVPASDPTGRSTLYYDPNFLTPSGLGFTPPIVTLYHEFGHVWADSNTAVPGGSTMEWHANPRDPGVMSAEATPNQERSVVGLPIANPDDPYGPRRVYPGQPRELTENDFREKLGLPPRQSYIPDN